MSVFGGIMLFAAGAIVGGGTVAWHQSGMNGIRKQAGREREQLQVELFTTKMEAECNRAWQEGYLEGRRKPESDIEAFARTFEGRRVSFRNRPVKKGA